MREALEAVTVNAARQYFEEARKGSLTAGKQADLVLLSADPLTVDPERLREVEVVETISRGITVWPAH
jgi:predicted amidohydrolase YtcJ